MPASARPGYGLVGIEERIKALGGRLDVANRGGEGLAVSAVLPAATGQHARSVGEQAGVS